MCKKKDCLKCLIELRSKMVERMTLTFVRVPSRTGRAKHQMEKMP